MTAGRGLALGMMGAPTSATNENFPQSAGFGAPLSAGLDSGSGSRRPSAIGNGGARQILPGQLPGPGQQRKGSMASIGAS
jgi:SAGA-associated factor 73